LGATGFEQSPVAASHAPTTWHASDAAHVTGFDPTHAPLTQASLRVHALPSLHAVPSATTGFEHCPLAGLHVPAAWHWSDAAHVTGFDPVQLPDWHVSVWVHPFPSLHVVPSAATGFEHCPVLASHVPAAWHWSEAVHVTGFEPVHAPAWHESLCVHAFPSLHDVPSAFAGFEHCPVVASHVPAE